MNPNAFEVFGLQIHWYGILISMGLVFGILFSQYTCRLKNISYDKLIDIVLIAIPIGIIGARTYYVLFNLENYENIFQMINIRGGGLAIHGGIIGGFLTALIYTKMKKLNFIKYADAAVPCIIIAQSLGRWGNFFNSEAHGGEVSYEFIKHFPYFIQKGMHIDGVYYHPTFLYESICNLIIFGILIYILKSKRRDGTSLFTYIGLYSLGRFFIEGFRTDSLMLGNIRVAQMMSVIGILLFIVFLIYSKTHKEGIYK